MLYHDEEFEAHGDRSSISGTAVYDVCVENYYDSDIGGSDGPDITSCRLQYVDLDGAKFNREQLTQMLTPAIVADIEYSVCEDSRHEILEAASDAALSYAHERSGRKACRVCSYD